MDEESIYTLELLRTSTKEDEGLAYELPCPDAERRLIETLMSKYSSQVRDVQVREPAVVTDVGTPSDSD